MSVLSLLRVRLSLNGRVVVQLSSDRVAVVSERRVLVYAIKRSPVRGLLIGDRSIGALVLVLTGLGALSFVFGLSDDPGADVLTADRSLLESAGSWFPACRSWSALCFNRRFRSLQAKKPMPKRLPSSLCSYDVPDDIPADSVLNASAPFAV